MRKLNLLISKLLVVSTFATLLLAPPGSASELLHPAAVIGESGPNNTSGTANTIPSGTQYVAGTVSLAGNPAQATQLQPPLAVNKVRVQPPDGVTTTGERVIFEIGITNNGVNPIVNLPLRDTYAAAFLTYLEASPQSNDNVNDGLINWADLTGASPNGFGQALSPGGTFSVTTILEAFAPTILATGTANTARVQGARDSSGETLDPADDSAMIIVLQGPTATKNTITGDVNFDCGVTALDLQEVASWWGYARGQFGFWPGWDLNGDGVVNAGDVQLGAGAWRDVLKGDVDANRIVTISDLQAITSQWGQIATDPRYDLNGDGVVNHQDAQIASSYWRKGC
jgi:hypothetical protein